jgi:hypothetical protein
MRANKGTIVTLAIAMTILPISGASSVGAEPGAGPTLAVSPLTGPMRPWPTFAGYGVRTVDRRMPADLTATIPVLDPGDCAFDTGVVGLLGVVTRATGQLAAGEIISICSAGVLYLYVRLVNAQGQQFDFHDPTAVGDQIVVTITRKDGAMTIGAENITKGWHHEISGSLFDVHEIDVGESTAQAGGFALALPDIPPAQITSVVYGKRTLQEADQFRWTCVGEDGTVRMRPTKITDGTDFAVRFRAP